MQNTQEATNPIVTRLTFSYRAMTSSMKFMLEKHTIELPFFLSHNNLKISLLSWFAFIVS